MSFQTLPPHKVIVQKKQDGNEYNYGQSCDGGIRRITRGVGFDKVVSGIYI